MLIQGDDTHDPMTTFRESIRSTEYHLQEGCEEIVDQRHLPLIFCHDDTKPRRYTKGNKINFLTFVKSCVCALLHVSHTGVFSRLCGPPERVFVMLVFYFLTAFQREIFYKKYRTPIPPFTSKSVAGTRSRRGATSKNKLNRLLGIT